MATAFMDNVLTQRYGPGLLRDILISPELEHDLPLSAIRVLQTLFLPSGLNLRNLIVRTGPVLC